MQVFKEDEMKLNMAVKESTSIHSDRLFSIARELSGMGFDPINVTFEDLFHYTREQSDSVS